MPYNSDTIGPMLEDKREELGRICERYGVQRLDLFGSALGKDFDPDNSYVDFVVTFVPQSPARLFDRYFGLKEELDMLLGHRVDLVMEGVALHHNSGSYTRSSISILNKSPHLVFDCNLGARPEGAILRNPYFARSINESRTTVYAA